MYISVSVHLSVIVNNLPPEDKAKLDIFFWIFFWIETEHKLKDNCL